jgi:MFS family permease
LGSEFQDGNAERPVLRGARNRPRDPGATNPYQRESETRMSERDTTWISEWDPENDKFWESKGKYIARRNLIWSIAAEHLGFSIWLIWSIVATKLPQIGFHYTTDQLFQLVALPGLVGSLMRFPYTFAVPRFGGPNWTMVSAALLFIPTIALAYCVSRPDTPFWVMLAAAATAGLGGGNFASSMANISFFYPDRMKGWALGLNAAGGNIGVSSVQFLTPILIGCGWLNFYLAAPQGGTGICLQNAGLMWLPLIAAALYGAYRYMNNLSSARSTFADQMVIVRRKHTWVMAWLYIGTFGSFIGYSAAFPLLLKTLFPTVEVGIAFPRAIGRFRCPPAWWLACRRARRCASYVLQLCCDGRRHDGRHVLRRHQKLRRLSRDVPGLVRHDRHRQRLDLSHDPVDLPRKETARVKERKQPGSRRGRQVSRCRECRCARLHIRHWRLRRISDPQRLWRFDRHYWRASSGARNFSGVLRHVRGADLVALPAARLSRRTRPEPG